MVQNKTAIVTGAADAAGVVRRAPGAGRKLRVPGDPVVKVTMTLRASVVAALDALGGSRSERADALIAEALAARGASAKRKARRRSSVRGGSGKRGVSA